MPIKDWALAYARIGWPVFPVTRYKTPFKGSHGHLDATTDPAQIEAWWAKRPDANIGLACGNVVVIDADGASAVARLKEIGARNGGFPRTAMVRTARGIHLYFRSPPGVRVGMGGERRKNAGDDGIDFRGHGGWAVLPPSVNAKNGFVWKWISPLPLAELPDWLMGEIMPKPRITTSSLPHLGPVPTYLQSNQRDIGKTLSESLALAYSPSEHARLESALKAISANGYYDWINVGMALKTLNWERPDGTSLAFDLYDAWSATCPEKYSQAATEAKWNSFKRSGVSVGTIYHLAQQHGWTGLPAIALEAPAAGAASPGLNGHDHGLNGHANGATALPAAFAAAQGQAIFFPDRTEEGKVKPTMLNAKVAIIALGIECKYDLFHNRMLVAGEAISKWNSTELSDHVTTMLRDIIRAKFQFDPKKENTQDACETLCLARRFDPVLDYLDSLQWDGQPRLDRWMSTYLGAPDTELNRAIARLSLLAAVRRARQPGAKFDQIIVLEGRQGAGKSEAIRILAGTDNFSDQKILGVDDRKQQELTEGVWLYEIAELTGLRKTEIEHVKAFVSRTVDRARPAYGRYMVSQPRRTVFFGSTNPGQPYLQDDTGNRRFWPVVVNRIDLRALERDRDQLWAEACLREAAGESHILPESLWGVAAELQEERTETDEWAEAIAGYIALKQLSEVSLMQVLTDNQFIRLEAASVGQKEQNRAARILRGQGFTRYQRRDDAGRRVWRYRRS